VKSSFGTLFVVLEGCAKTAKHLGGGLKQSLRFGFLEFVQIAAEMFDYISEHLLNICGVMSRIEV